MDDIRVNSEVSDVELKNIFSKPLTFQIQICITVHESNEIQEREADDA